MLNVEAPLPFVGSTTLGTDVVEAAEQLRGVLGWTRNVSRQFPNWDSALTRLRENAEEAGVLVMISGIVGSNTRRKLNPEEFRGFALVDPNAAVVL